MGDNKEVMKKQRGMKIEMARVPLIELYKALQTQSPDGMYKIPEYARQDFIDRNREKFNKVSQIHDELIEFPVYSVVAFRPNEDGFRSDSIEYFVSRVKKLPNGKREYWLNDMGGFYYRGVGDSGYSCYSDGETVYPERKVSSSKLRKIRDLGPSERNALARYRLPGTPRQQLQTA